jgi:hypothetical protein
MRLHFFPYSSAVGIAALLGIAASTFFVDGLRYTVPAFAPFLLLISLAYWSIRRKAVSVTADPAEGELVPASPRK